MDSANGVRFLRALRIVVQDDNLKDGIPDQVGNDTSFPVIARLYYGRGDLVFAFNSLSPLCGTVLSKRKSRSDLQRRF